MRTETAARLKAEIDDHLQAGTTTMAPAELFEPAAVYHDPELAQGELRAMFRSLPVVVAHGSDLPNAGDYVATEVASMPVLAVRQGDGSVSVFINVCRHRGSPLVEQGGGCARRFTCPYHAWSYDTDGVLVGVPNADGFTGVDRSTLGLIRLPSEVRHGFVWAVLDPDATCDVAGLLGELDDELSAWGLDGYVVERSTSVSVDCNWKLIVDGFLETYHLRFLHSATVGPHIRSNLGPFRAFGPHGRMAIVRTRYQSDQEFDDARFRRDVGAVYQVFPNTVLVWQSGQFEAWHITPDPHDPGRCTARVSLLAPAGRVDDVSTWDLNWKILLDTVEKEDWPVACGTQASFAAGAPKELVFGRNEPALQHFHREIATHIGR
jgi:phenylpropionate dioxygenase-like ring-hydroxylating dioxygenase large terminal subunit